MGKHPKDNDTSVLFDRVSKLTLSRRAVLQAATVAAGLAAISPLGTGTALAEDAFRYRPTSLTAHELETLKAVMGRLIPADDTSGGAVEAHAFVYIDRELGHAYASSSSLYHTGLAGLDQQARDEGANAFSQLASDRQYAILKKLEAGGLDDKIRNGKAFFATVRQHTLEGMFGDPMYGGNYQFIGWDLLGYYGVQLVYNADQQAIGTNVKPSHQGAGDLGGEPVL